MLSEVSNAVSIVCEAIRALNKHCEYASLSGESAWEGANGYQEFAAFLSDKAKECALLDIHEHVWDEDQYCVLCRADGRA